MLKAKKLLDCLKKQQPRLEANKERLRKELEGLKQKTNKSDEDLKKETKTQKELIDEERSLSHANADIKYYEKKLAEGLLDYRNTRTNKEILDDLTASMDALGKKKVKLIKEVKRIETEMEQGKTKQQLKVLEQQRRRSKKKLIDTERLLDHNEADIHYFKQKLDSPDGDDMDEGDILTTMSSLLFPSF